MGLPAEERKLRSYRRIAELGRGGMANVYLAASRGPHGFTKLVVIKELKEELADNPEFQTMFMDEARLAARLNHPNIVQTNEVSETGIPFMVMEYLEGQPLHRVWSTLSRRDMPLPAQLYVVSNVLGGLDYAHELRDFDGTPLSVVHRDVSPHNVFITYSGEVKLVDFGIAKANDSSFKTEIGTLKGKLAYMPPEQAKGERVDRRADVFAVGVVLWEAAVGRRLWKGLKDVAILHNLVSGTIPSPRSVNPQVPEALEAIIMRALAPDARKRYDSAAEFQREVDRFAESLDVRWSRRELGQVVTDAFVEERERIRSAVDEQMRLTRSLPTEEVRAVNLAVPTIPPGANLSGGFPAMTGPLGTGSLPPMPASAPGLPNMTGSHPGISVSRSSAHLPIGPESSSIRPPASIPSNPPARKSPIIAVLFGALAVLLPASGFAVFRAVTHSAASPGESGTAAHVQVTPATDTAPVVPPPRPRDTRVIVHLKPVEATLTLDGEPVSLDAEGAFARPRDGAQHKLRAEAKGYLPKEAPLSLDADGTVDWSLTKALVVAPVQRGTTGAQGPAGGRNTGTTPANTGASSGTTTGSKDPETPDLGY